MGSGIIAGLRGCSLPQYLVSAGLACLLMLTANSSVAAGESVSVTLRDQGLEYVRDVVASEADCACRSFAHGCFSCPCSHGLELEKWCGCRDNRQHCTCRIGHADAFSHFCCPCNPCPGCGKLSALEAELGSVKASLGSIEQKLATPQAAKGRPYDYSRFISRKVRMYYFTDIRQIMTVLKQSTGVNEYGSYAGLKNSETDAQADLRRAEAELAVLNEDIVKLRNAALAADNALNAAFRKLYEAQARQKTASENVDRLAASSADEEQKQQARLALEAADNQLAVIQAELKPTEENARSPFDKLSEAEAAVAAKKKEIDLKRVSLVDLRAIELEDFALRRDNAPVIYAMGTDKSLNPLDRVSIFGLPDSHQLVVRGEIQDVEAVCMDIKQELDEPQPQSTLQIWNLELNSTASEKGDAVVNWAFEELEREFRDTREQIDICRTTLADCINELVVSVSEESAALQTPFYMLDRLVVYDDRVLESFGLTFGQLEKSGSIVEYRLRDGHKSANMENREISYALRHEPGCSCSDGHCPVKPDFPDILKYDFHCSSEFNGWAGYIYMNHIIPDPAQVSTLSEALVVLSLLKKEHREWVLNEFEDRVSRQLGWQCLDKDARGYFCFSRIRRLLNCDNGTAGRTAGPNIANQQIITDALRRVALDRYLPRFVSNMSNLVEEIKQLDGVDLGTAKKPLPFGSASPYQQHDYLVSRYGAGSRMNTDALVRDLGPDYYKAANFLNAIQWVKQATSISYVELFETAKRQQEHDAWFFEESEVNAETAKANEYLKSFSKALQDEFDEYFVDPMLRRLQARLSDKGLGVGVIQRDRLLTTNRRVARIDPKASAELSIGQTEDVLADIGQIAELLGILEPLAGGGLEPSEKLSQLAQGLQDSAREDDPAEIYGFSSGNTFKVTTIHEPGGQGLRFNLDYNHASVITDPDGSTGARDPRLPRFERNTINTEVQLDNLEFRLVASHETNAAFGKAEKKIGGIPFIKDDPIIRDLPLLGYFKRSRGQAALRQHHLIFAQATIYPTISEVMSLMTTPIPYDGRHLDHLYETSEREKQQQDLLAKAKLAEKLKEQNKQYQEDLSRLLEDLTQDKDDSESESDVWLVNWDGDALEGEVLRRECVCQPGSACSCAVPGKLYSFGIRLIENASMHEFVRMPSFGYRQLSRDAAGKAFADDEARLAYWLCVLECRPCPGRDCSCSLQGLAVANPDSLPPGNMVPGCSANLKDLQNGNQAFRVRLVSREEK